MNQIKQIETILKRLDYLWHNEIVDRCCICVSAPKDPLHPYHEEPPKSREDLRRWYLDGEWILQRNLKRLQQTYFAGDALPMVFPYFGTGGHAKYLCPESRVEYSPETIWIHPSIESYDTFSFDFDPDCNPCFQEELKIVSYLAEEAKGRYLVGMPDNCGSYDALAQLRGNENLLMDFLTDPESTKQAAHQLIDILRITGDRFFQAVSQNCFGGSVHGWMNTWSPGKQMQLQCDLSVMISPDVFREFIVPELEATSSWLSHSCYHLDGMEQIRHLDMILSVPNINMIQWTQVDGQPPAVDFIPQLRKIQKAGKGLVLLISKIHLKPILENLSVKGLQLIVTDASDPEEADRIVKYFSAYHE